MLLARLDRIVTSGENMHKQLYEKDTEKFDIEEIGKFFKIQLKGKTPPCVIRIKQEDTLARDLKAYWSDEYREPGEDANHGTS